MAWVIVRHGKEIQSAYLKQTNEKQNLSLIISTEINEIYTK